MYNKARLLAIAVLGSFVVFVSGSGTTANSAESEAKPFKPQPLIVLDGDTIIYNDIIIDCH